MDIKAEFKSKLNLEDIMITEASFNRAEDSLDELTLELKIDRKIEELENNRFKVYLAVYVGDNENKLSINVKSLAVFSMEHYQDVLVERNALAIMFPYVRSYISTITTQPGMCPIVLPAINIVSMLNKER